MIEPNKCDPEWTHYSGPCGAVDCYLLSDRDSILSRKGAKLDGYEINLGETIIWDPAL